MEAFRVEPTDLTPRLLFDPKSNYFEISGFSRPENVTSFYAPVFDWLRNFGQTVLSQNTRFDRSQIVLNLKLIYFNSASAKFLLDILQEFVGFHNRGNSVTFNWYYETGDDTILESGEELSETLGYPFHFIPYE